LLLLPLGLARLVGAGDTVVVAFVKGVDEFVRTATALVVPAVDARVLLDSLTGAETEVAGVLLKEVGDSAPVAEVSLMAEE
jgi:hypothetical protein